MKQLFALLTITLFTSFSFAGVRAYQSTTNLGVFANVKCSTGLTCTKVGDKLNMVATPTMSTLTNFMGWRPSTLTSGTSTTPGATTVYMSQVFIPGSVTLTGIKVNNGATVGTDKYIAALFSSSGAVLANSALAGTTTAGADAYQTLAFTSTYAAVPGVYWIGLYVNGTTDRFRSTPAVGQYGGLAGSVTGQTFGTVAAVTVPTTFTADKGPVAFTY